MDQRESSWVTVRVAAEAVGVSEPKLRAAYRAGKLDVRDDLIGGRLRKLVDMGEVRAWAGLPPLEPAPSPAAATSPFEGLALDVKRAVEGATRAEQQVVFLRNEMAQLQAAHARVRDIVDRQNAESFRALAGAACADAQVRRRPRRFLGLAVRRPSA